MEISRGTIFIGAMILLAAILTVTLAAVVYDGTPSKNTVSYDNVASDGQPGVTLGSTPGSVAPGCTDPLIGTWQEAGDHTYTFDGTCCYVDQDPTPWPYFAHAESVLTHSRSWYRTTIYSCADSPGEGYGFIDGRLYFIVLGNTHWDVWWELNKIDFKDPVIGTWSNGHGSQLTFDGSSIHIDERGFLFTYTYHRAWDTIGQSYGRYPHNYGAQVIYQPDYWGNPWCGINGFYMRNGKLYGCYYNTLNKDYDGYNFWIPEESEAWIFQKVT